MSDGWILGILGVVTLIYFGVLATAHVWMVPREHLPKRKRREPNPEESGPSESTDED